MTELLIIIGGLLYTAYTVCLLYFIGRKYSYPKAYILFMVGCLLPILLTVTLVAQKGLL